MIDLYQVLGVPPTASQDEIKAAYRKLAQLHHPDRGGDKNRMADINGAYAVLSDAERRALYDAKRRSGIYYGSVREAAESVAAEALQSLETLGRQIAREALSSRMGRVGAAAADGADLVIGAAATTVREKFAAWLGQRDKSDGTRSRPTDTATAGNAGSTGGRTGRA